MQSPRIFISHGKQDAWVAQRVARDVQESGATTFLDESDIAKGDDFKKKVHAEIAACTELLALFTPWSCQRSWVWVEVGAAWGQGKRIVAVLYGVTVPELEKYAGGRAILEDINVLELNEFDSYLEELRIRIEDCGNG